MEKLELTPKNLLLTEQGENWLKNFDDEDKQSARILAFNLMLISEIEFERKLLSSIEIGANRFGGLVALFGVRELNSGESIFDAADGMVHSTPRGNDVGSEGRIANIIRNLARNKPGKFLNHPTINEMRRSRCDAVFFVDDFIGSGKRIEDYATAFYAPRTIKSWFSYHKLQAEIYAYSGTQEGIRRVSQMKIGSSVEIVRSCPTIDTALWKEDERKAVTDLCKKYARRAKMQHPLGFGKVGALIVFEHSCPNNCPQILWGSPKNFHWEALFVGKALASEVRAVFPPEIVRRDPVSVLIAAGEKRIAKSARQLVMRPLPAEWLAILSLFSRGIRQSEAIEWATGMGRKDAYELVEKCIATGLLTQNRRLSDLGRQELRAAQKITAGDSKPLPRGTEEDYYPLSLRSHK